MEYEVKAVKKIGVSGYEADMNKEIKSMAANGWVVQQILGSPDQDFVILFVKAN